jgi:site-specific recombinase XerD
MIPDTKPNRLPQMPSSESLRKFWQTIESAGNLRDIILLKLAFLTGARNSEIRNIRKDQIDLEENRIYILQGKGSKDRYVLFPDSFSLPLRAYLQLLTKTAWLFPNNVGSPISARRFQQLAAEYTAKAGLDIRIHPHKLRHLLLTQLTESGMPDAQIQLISGHANRESLKIYQHVALPGVQAGYEKAMKGKE